MMSERTKLRCAFQRQQSLLKQQLPTSVFENVPGEYETAFTICEKEGKLCRGSQSTGSLTAVSLDIGCPSGWKPTGIHHTHPKGNANPSDADIAEMKKLRLRNMCISVPSGPNAGELKCYKVDR
jgi:hypothetical protein